MSKMAIIAYFISAIYFSIVTTGNSSNDFIPLKLAAFNVQAFGTAKVSDNAVVDILVKIIRRYDIILIQEIRDIKQRAIQTLLNQVNTHQVNKYDVAVSPRLGRTNSKEQYAFIYRSDRVKLVKAYLYSDRSDVFEREPYVVLFKWHYTEFFMIGIHTSPDSAPREIDKLAYVYNSAKLKFKTDNGIILGDFNADCKYVTNSEWPTIKLATDNQFYWLIDDRIDTTTRSTNCAYDRKVDGESFGVIDFQGFVVAGSKMLKMVLPGSAKSFNYGNAYGLTQTMTEQISDHYPIEMTLVSVKYRSKFKNGKFSRTYHPKSGKFSKQKLFALRRDAITKRRYAIKTYYTISGGVNSFSIGDAANGRTRLSLSINQLCKDFGDFVSQSQRDIINTRINELSTSHFLPSSNGHYQTLRDYYETLSSRYTILLKCNVNELSCYVLVDLVEA